jgi:hypothetical protein
MVVFMPVCAWNISFSSVLGVIIPATLLFGGKTRKVMLLVGKCTSVE